MPLFQKFITDLEEFKIQAKDMEPESDKIPTPARYPMGPRPAHSSHRMSHPKDIHRPCATFSLEQNMDMENYRFQEKKKSKLSLRMPIPNLGPLQEIRKKISPSNFRIVSNFGAPYGTGPQGPNPRED